MTKREIVRKIRIRNQTAFIVNDKARNHALINLKKGCLVNFKIHVGCSCIKLREKISAKNIKGTFCTQKGWRDNIGNTYPYTTNTYAIWNSIARIMTLISVIYSRFHRLGLSHADFHYFRGPPKYDKYIF